jgi:thioredoxin reductase (NADPH)
VTGLDVTGASHTVHFDDGSTVSGHAVILATGVIYRQLPAPGCDLLTDRGVYYGATLTVADQCVGQDVYVVGGANSAGQAAVNLALRGNARSVTMLVRAPDLTASMSHYLIERVTLRDLKTGNSETVDCGSLFVFIGAVPRTDWLDGVVARDKRGFVVAGPDLTSDELAGWPLERPPYHLETSVPGVFVAGDVRAESAKRVASAVGEGAMAVMLVHRYLEQL